MAIVPDSNFSVSYGSFIRNGRHAKNLSQTEVAKHLNISQAYYSALELGIRNIDLSLAMKICSFLDLDLGDFIKSYDLR